MSPPSSLRTAFSQAAALCLICVGPLTAAQTRGEDALALLRAYYGSILDVRVEYETKTEATDGSPDAGTEMSGVWTWRTDGSAEAAEEALRFDGKTRRVGFADLNGSHTILNYPSEDAPAVAQPLAQVEPGRLPRDAQLIGLPKVFHTWGIATTHVWHEILARPENYVFELLSDNENGLARVRVADPKSGLVVEVVLDPARGCLPVRQTLTSTLVPSLRIAMIVDQAVEPVPGLWYPYRFRRTTPGSVTTYTLKSAAVNRGVSDKEFELALPPRTRLVNKITGERFVMPDTPANAQAKARTQEAAARQLDQALAVAGRLPAPPSAHVSGRSGSAVPLSSGFWYGTGVIAGLALLIVAAVAPNVYTRVTRRAKA